MERGIGFACDLSGVTDVNGGISDVVVSSAALGTAMIVDFLLCLSEDCFDSTTSFSEALLDAMGLAA